MAKILLAIIIGISFGLPTALAQDQLNPKRVELLRSEWERDPGNIKLALLLGGMLRREGKADEAYSIVDTALDNLGARIEAGEDSSELYYGVGMGALFLNRNYLALERFQLALSLEPEREEIHLGLVRALLELNRLEEASAALELATVLFPESDAIKSQLAEIYQRGGAYEKAISFLEELRMINPDDSGIFNRLLAAYVEAGEVEKATPFFEQLVEAGELGELDMQLQIFRILLAKGDLRSARVALQRATEVDEKSRQVKDAFGEYYALQAAEAEKGENYRRAILFWERSLENAPDVWRTEYRLALAHAALENHEEALEHYLPLLERRPADPLFYGDLALTMMALKRFDAADKAVGLGVRVATASNSHSALTRLGDIRNRIARVRESGVSR